MLALCSADRQEPDAALALARWEELQRVADGDRTQRRFRRRAFERARDRALTTIAMRIKPWMLSRSLAGSGGAARLRDRRGRRRGLARRAAS
ncbi:MAG TPA: hypothetical protein VGI50_16555 [Solirubrobacteraceae bacterium]